MAPVTDAQLDALSEIATATSRLRSMAEDTADAAAHVLRHLDSNRIPITTPSANGLAATADGVWTLATALTKACDLPKDLVDAAIGGDLWAAIRANDAAILDGTEQQ